MTGSRRKLPLYTPSTVISPSGPPLCPSVRPSVQPATLSSLPWTLLGPSLVLAALPASTCRRKSRHWNLDRVTVKRCDLGLLRSRGVWSPPMSQNCWARFTWITYAEGQACSRDMITVVSVLPGFSHCLYSLLFLPDTAVSFKKKKVLLTSCCTGSLRQGFGGGRGEVLRGGSLSVALVYPPRLPLHPSSRLPSRAAAGGLDGGCVRARGWGSAGMCVEQPSACSAEG